MTGGNIRKQKIRVNKQVKNNNINNKKNTRGYTQAPLVEISQYQVENTGFLLVLVSSPWVTYAKKGMPRRVMMRNINVSPSES